MDAIGDVLREALHQNKVMYRILKELEESAEYWSEYDVPVGIVERIKNATATVEASDLFDR